MARVFITGSADGLGRAAAQTLLETATRSSSTLATQIALRPCTTAGRGAEAVVGDLSDLEQTREVAGQVNQLGPIDAAIHNAGVIQRPPRPARQRGRPVPADRADRPPAAPDLPHKQQAPRRPGPPDRIDWSGQRATGSYSDSKLFVTTLAAAVARIWPDVLSNAVDPGWVPTKMGGPGAPDDLRLGHLTQEWLAPATIRTPWTSGGYWHHQHRAEPAPAVHDRRFQDELLEALASFTTTPLPQQNRRSAPA